MMSQRFPSQTGDNVFSINGFTPANYLLTLLFLTSVIATLTTTTLHAENGMLWSRTYHRDNSEIAKAFIATEDGGFLIVSTNYQDSAAVPDISLIKVNADNEREFHRQIRLPGRQEINDLTLTPDGDYLLVGNAPRFVEDRAYSYGCIFRLNDEMEIIEERFYGSTGEFQQIRALPGGGYVIAGELGNAAWLLVCDEEGNAELSQRLPFSSFNGIEITANGNIVMQTVETRGTSRLISYDREGNTVWERFAFEQNLNSRDMTNVTKTADGNLVTVFASSFGNFYITKIDQQGETVWANTFEDQHGGSFEKAIGLANGNILCLGSYQMALLNANGEILTFIPNLNIRDRLDGVYSSISIVDLLAHGDHTSVLIRTSYEALDRGSTLGDIVTANLTSEGVDGSWIWDEPGGAFETAEGIFPLPFGRLAVQTFSNSSSHAGLTQGIMIVEENGDSVTTYDSPLSPNEQHQRFLRPTSDGGFYELTTWQPRGEDVEASLKKLNSNFDLLWQVAVTPPLNRYYSWGISDVLVDGNDNILFAGDYHEELFLKKLDNRGQPVDSLTGMPVGILRLINTDQGYAALLSSSEVEFYSRSLVSQGYLDAGVPNYQNLPVDIVAGEDGALAVLLRAAPTEAVDSVFITQFTGNRERQWLTRLPKPLTFDGNFRVLNDNRGGFVVAMPGKIAWVNRNGDYHAYLTPPWDTDYSPEYRFLDYMIQPDGGLICAGYKNNDVWLGKYSLDSLILGLPREIPPPNATTFTVWPNPFNARASVAFQLTKSGVVTVRLYDLGGRICQTIQLGELQAGRGSFELNGDGLASGLYILTLDTGIDRLTRKVVIEK